MAMNGFGGWGKPASGGWGPAKTGGFGGWGNASPKTQPFGSTAPLPGNTMATPTRSPFATPFAGNTMATPTSNPFAPQPGNTMVTPTTNPYASSAGMQGGYPQPMPSAAAGPISSGSGFAGLPSGSADIMQQQIQRLAGQYGQLPQGMDTAGIVAAQRAQGLNASQILSNLRNLYSQSGSSVPRVNDPGDGFYRPI